MAVMRVLIGVVWVATVVLAGVFIDATARGKYLAWMLRNYLMGTKRRKWVDARPFIEDGLRHGAQATDAFALGLAWLPENPDKAYVVNLLETYELSDATRATLKSRYKIQ